MKANAKMSGEERRAAIIRAVRRVFAEKGTSGSTTRELAHAAGVSEALLFKHFPNKEALYAAMIQGCMQEKKQEFYQRLLALEPSAATLVTHVHLMASHLVGGHRLDGDDDEIPVRLLQRSMMEDGALARLLHERLGAPMMSKMEECLKAAVASGDAIAGPTVPRLGAWFAQHLAMMTMFHLLPETPIIDYGVSRAALVEQMVWFALRGMGLKDEAIRRHYSAENTARFTQQWSSQNGIAKHRTAKNGAEKNGAMTSASRRLYTSSNSEKNGAVPAKVASSNGARRSQASRLTARRGKQRTA